MRTSSPRRSGGSLDYENRPSEDFARALVEYRDKAGNVKIVEATTSWCFVGAGLRLSMELLGPEYSMSLSSLDSGPKVFFSREVQGNAGEDLVEKQNAEVGLMPVVADEESEYGYVGENRHMVRCFLEGKRPDENFSDGVNVAELLMTAYMSAEEGRTIEFPPPGLDSFVPAVARGEWNPKRSEIRNETTDGGLAGGGSGVRAGGSRGSRNDRGTDMAQVPEGYEQLLKSYDGRYHKAGWNHYGPGYFELDPATGILTSHGGMGLFWYSVKDYSDFVLELDFRCTDAETNSGVFVRVPGVPTSDDYIYHSFEIQIYDAGEGIHLTGRGLRRRSSHPPGLQPARGVEPLQDHLRGKPPAGGAERRGDHGLGGRGPGEGGGLRAPGVRRPPEP